MIGKLQIIGAEIWVATLSPHKTGDKDYWRYWDVYSMKLPGRNIKSSCLEMP